VADFAKKAAKSRPKAKSVQGARGRRSEVHDSSRFYIKKVHQQANRFAFSLHFLAFWVSVPPKQGKEKGYSP
jgi:hypothetical protein